MRIIIALDIIDGKCVRLTKGDFSTSKVYSEDPVDIARQVEDHGLKYLHLVDLDGARNRRIVNYRILEQISSSTSLNIDFGGGIRTTDDLRKIFNSGADQISCGSISVTDEPLFLDWLNEFGPEKIILAADSLNRRVASSGWTENTDRDIVTFLTEYRSKGVRYAICTDIEKDGMLQGPATGLYKDILDVGGLKLIASGGITTVSEIHQLSEIGCDGAIIGKALYEGLLNLNELSKLC
jgi:phosphoribosylformimino-5-aminoimidazole carboxamide ribotide isomerase